MNARGSLWLPLVVLLLLAALSYWIDQVVQEPASSSQTAKSSPEGIMENFEAMRTDLAGRPQYRLSAKRLKHYTGSKRTEMESPHLIQLSAQTGEIDTTARQATVSPQGDEVDLKGDVVIVRAAQPGQSVMTLRTARLLAYPDRNLLRAPGRVNVHDDLMDLRAGAMEYRAAQRLIILSGRVKAHYLPRKP
ncbi:MAG TPA: LPS export ABC transporter periplasmic protein LptC [Thiobacillus sp.]|nr:MAG: LPS export ABC transporter periplasmic protein LptC [Hydrogenophilales bacterium 28-61-11]OYZ57267.1 MAG: LPS export ABC transporter periplasmic protein LptC [Hydrogenophilales bacterium 16-61-112]HQT30703.1 LPS export ABC transporter periplasmic protein LptC [Thiobacillus sp.]HQT69507.1 LPS export ABC transporter periplasmic protein LptC [Thiobacillus sp.]